MNDNNAIKVTIKSGKNIINFFLAKFNLEQLEKRDFYTTRKQTNAAVMEYHNAIRLVEILKNKYGEDYEFNIVPIRCTKKHKAGYDD